MLCNYLLCGSRWLVAHFTVSCNRSISTIICRLSNHTDQLSYRSTSREVIGVPNGRYFVRPGNIDFFDIQFNKQRNRVQLSSIRVFECLDNWILGPGGISGLCRSGPKSISQAMVSVMLSVFHLPSQWGFKTALVSPTVTPTIKRPCASEQPR